MSANREAKLLFGGHLIDYLFKLAFNAASSSSTDASVVYFLVRSLIVLSVDER